MSSPVRLAAVKKAHAVRKKRKRAVAIHISLTDEEHDEFRRIAAEHGMLDRELLMNSVRAFKTITRRMEIAEASVVLLAARLEKLEQSSQPTVIIPQERADYAARTGRAV